MAGQPRDAQKLIDAICSDAVRLHGKDFQAVERHIRERLAALAGHEREAVEKELTRIVTSVKANSH